MNALRPVEPPQEVEAQLMRRNRYFLVAAGVFMVMGGIYTGIGDIVLNAVVLAAVGARLLWVQALGAAATTRCQSVWVARLRVMQMLWVATSLLDSVLLVAKTLAVVH